MQKVKCSQCGKELRLMGLGAICPHCGALVMATSLPPATPVEPEELLAPLDPQPENTPILDLLDEPPAEAQQVLPLADEFPQAPQPQWDRFEPPQPAPRNTTVYWVLGGLGFGVVMLIGVLLVLISTRPRTITVTVPAPPPPARPTAPQGPAGSEWFVDPSAPSATRPANRPVAIAPSPAPSPTIARTPAPTPTTAPVIPHLHLSRFEPRPPTSDSRSVTDEQIARAIEQATTYLLSQIAQTRLKNADAIDPETFAGLNALVTYALLQTGKSLNDPRLTPQGDLMKGLIDRLKEYPMRGNRATYSRSLRISALTVYSRPEDRSTINEDVQWLLRSSMSGAYSYEVPTPGRTREDRVWDNSNSQYGALGIWAAVEAGIQVPGTYWANVERHWIDAQTTSGGWAYLVPPHPATLSMTAAGVNMLFVSRDQLSMAGTGPPIYLPMSQHLLRGLEWLDEGDNAIKHNGEHRGYTLYSLERAGLASGFKYFGEHDWYLVFAKQLVEQQTTDGSWSSNDGPVADTAFCLLFLLRGREPVLYSKFRFDGTWNNRPRELSVLTRYTSHQLERAHNWQVADSRRAWYDWADAPTLMITSDKPPVFDEATHLRLREYARHGGMIFLHAEREGPEFDRFAEELSAKMFSEYPLNALPSDHPVYSSVVPLRQKPPLRGVSNGTRLLLLYSPTDLSRHWQPRPGRSQRVESDLGMNIAVYAAGKRDLRSRVSPLYVPEPATPPVTTIPLARLQYTGNWDPEPAAWPRTSRILQNRIGIALEPIRTAVVSLDYAQAPIAHLTGTAAAVLNADEIAALRRFVARGGILLIDAAGGSQAFADSMNALLPLIAGNSSLNPIPEDHMIRTGSFRTPDGRVLSVDALPRPHLRDGAPADDALPRMALVGRGAILFTPHDLTCGLVGANTTGIRGFQPDWTQRFIRNVVFWTTRHVAEVPTVP